MIVTPVTPKTGNEKQQADLANSASIRGEPAEDLSDIMGKIHSSNLVSLTVKTVLMLDYRLVTH